MPVYMIRQGLTGHVKIGVTGDVEKRIKQLQTGHSPRLRLMRLLEGGATEEKALHRRFAALSVGGEWFAFSEEMLVDLGFPDLPMPKIGKHGAANWPTSPCIYLTNLHQEITQLIGGLDALAKRCGIPPWRVGTEYHLDQSVWSAAVLLLHERGHTSITMQLLEDAADKRRMAVQRDAERRRRAEEVSKEADWLKRHPGVVPWWTLSSENMPRPPELTLIVDRDAA